MVWGLLAIAPERLYASLGLSGDAGAGTWVIFGLEGVAILCGFLKVGFGVGTGVVCTALAAMLLPAKSAVGLLAPLMLVSEIAAVGTYWGRWDTRRLTWLLPAALVGTLAGAALLVSLPPTALRRVIGAVALIYLLLNQRPTAAAMTVAAERTVAAGAGLAAGVLSGLSHAGGIILSMYFFSCNLGKEAFLASFAAALLLQSVVKLGLYWWLGLLDRNLLLFSLALTPFVMAGAVAGRRANLHIRPIVFRRILLGLLLVSGLYLLQ